jgi:nucleoside-diphosphate-sugar epimerase
MLLSTTDVSSEFRINTARLQPYDTKVPICGVTMLRHLTGWQNQIPFQRVLKDLLDYWRERVQIGNTH